MSQACFAGTLEEALGELEAVTAELERSDPEELAALGGLLARRRHAIEEVSSKLNQQGPGPEEQAARLGLVWQGGQQVEERLKLVAAGARHQLQELFRAGCLARAISGDLGQAGQRFDIEA